MASRVERNPLKVPANVKVAIENGIVIAKNSKETLQHEIPLGVLLTIDNDQIKFAVDSSVENSVALTGTTKAIINNIFIGLQRGYERKLLLVGVGYKAQMQGTKLVLSVGYAHQIEYPVPTGITIEIPSQTEVLIKGSDKCLVGQVAANIRSFRAPEPYKGKGIRYANETITLKEGKKK